VVIKLKEKKLAHVIIYCYNLRRGGIGKLLIILLHRWLKEIRM
jgi:hypothetical protein